MLDPRFLVAAACVVGASLLQAPLGRANADRMRHELRYVPDPDVARLLSLGHRSAFADALWLLSLPDISREFPDVARKERWLSGVLDAVTELDPTFTTVYEYGANYLTLLDRRVRPTAPPRARAHASLAIVTKGYEAFSRLEEEHGHRYPGAFVLLRKIALIHYMDRKDEEAALAVLDRCAEREDCDLLTRQMWSSMRSERGGELVALAHWAELAEHANPDVAFEGRVQLARTKSQIARRAARRFADAHGRPPASVEELAGSGALDEAVAAVVLDGAVVADGDLVHPEVLELERESRRRDLEWAAEIYRRDHGVWPTEAWLLDPGNPLLQGRSTPPGEGLRWSIDGEGRVRAVPANPE